MIVGSDNPGSRDTHTVQHTFEIRAPGPVQVGTQAGGELPGDGLVADTELVHDELIIRWGNLPRHTRVTLYSPTLDMNGVLALASARGGPDLLHRADAHTLECVVGDMTFVPLPFGSTTNIPALLTLELPDTVRYEETFRVLLQQSAGLPRRDHRHRGGHGPGTQSRHAAPRREEQTGGPAPRRTQFPARPLGSHHCPIHRAGCGPRARLRRQPGHDPWVGIGSPHDQTRGCLPRWAGLAIRLIRRLFRRTRLVGGSLDAGAARFVAGVVPRVPPAWRS